LLVAVAGYNHLEALGGGQGLHDDRAHEIARGRALEPVG
jgi:hypothetical protein